MSIRNLFEDCCNAGMYVLTVVQFDTILKYIQLGLSILLSLIILFSRFSNWWKKAKSDGKITKDELEEGKKIIEDGLNDIKDKIEK